MWVLMGIDKPKTRKRNVYFPKDLAAEVQEQADRLDRSPSWMLIRAWVMAAPLLRQMNTEVDPGKGSTVAKEDGRDV
jgi:uncharacterized small protein (TIGR04563 family)